MPSALLRWLLASDEEQEPGFAQEIEALSRRGLHVAGVLGVVCIVALLVGYGVQGQIRFSVFSQPASDQVALWDKLVVLGGGLLALVLARTAFGARHGRLLVALMVLADSLAILLDDLITKQDVSFTAAYLVLILFLVVGTMPYRPWQTLLLSLGVAGLFPAGVHLLGPWLATETPEMKVSSGVFLLMAAIASTAISGLLYYSRYDRYRTLQEARRLNTALEARTEALEAEQHRTEAQALRLQEQATRLQAMEQMKTRFFANLSHEFRTPLTLILGPVDDILNDTFGPVSGDLQRQLGLVQRNGRYLQRLINELLDLATLEAGGMTLHLRGENLPRFLRSLVFSFAALAERRRIQLTCEAHPEDLVVALDAAKLEKVVFNLLSNAFKFTPEGGAIRVRCQQQVQHGQEQVEIRVRDTGPGISAAALGYVFDRFYQAEQSPGHASSGIGLALCKELVELHGGRIDVVSEPGFGSEFIVTLPVTPAEALPGLARSSFDTLPDPGEEDDVTGTTVEAPADAPLVLVVEDHADVRAYLRRHLAGRYRLAEAENGRTGLEQARHRRPDLVVSDVMMPEMDGYALCQAIRSDPALAHLPVILLTARASEADKLEGLGTGADDYLSKPFNAAELLARAENLIEGRRFLREYFGALASTPPVPVQAHPVTVPSAEARFVEKVQAVVEAHLGDHSFGVEWLADELGMSTRTLQRHLQAATRLSVAGFIRMIRLQRAAQLLRQQAGTVAEVAYQMGFQDADYFARLFRQMFACTPSEYLKKPTT
jgi:signal transduction histidine kinase/DNA-binding response OmpR family regulator